MAIYINYTNKSLQFLSKDKNKMSLLESFTQKPQEIEQEEISSENEIINEEQDELNEEINENVNLDENLQEKDNLENEDILESDNNLEIEAGLETEKTEISKSGVLDFSEPNSFKWKLDELESASLEEFTNKFSKNEIEIPEDLLVQIKQDKQLLILPDEIVSFDFVTVPNLSPWRSASALNLKLSINYKNIDKLSKKSKSVSKSKANVIYSVCLSRAELASKYSEFFSQNGVKIKGVNFYSSCLADFYSSHIRGAKSASIVVKVAENHTTILAIVHGTLVAIDSLHSGEKDLYRNSTYKFDEYSRRSTSHKFVCYAISKISGENNESKKSEEKITKDQIEKAYSKTRTNPLAAKFQSKSINIADLIRKKIDDMIMFLETSELEIKIEKIFIDVKNNETFEKLKMANAVKVYFPEGVIFKSAKSNEMFKNRLISSNITNKGFSWRNLWGRKNKEQ